ncbi:acyltransferase [Ramlibacter alkalitolerans]|uniref:Acyltransferase n=1 Tax=Ramlibacter alkalitolerans TaxID=2039631 RepID=A0ABS1JHB5_9BURK|nr:acyltransferase [Ramlibacter alkalitolerans]MBL0423610.1 acyltransferase [Ramlibacter alkalitolerans]
MRSPLTFLPAPVRGALAVLALAANTLLCTLPLFAFALLKLAFPFALVRRRVDPVLHAIARAWVAGNSLWMRLLHPTQWEVQGLPPARRGWYLVNCNHQSWADIFVLQHLLHGRLPMLKFFLKQELIYVPVIGLAWWALDFPFMKRHGKEALRRNPARRADDHEATLRACRKFALVPTSVMNFAEGTRFTAEKHVQTASPYRHLLKPKAGAMALTLGAMGEQFDALIDVTIAYSPQIPSFWDFACGRVRRVAVHVEQLPIPAEFIGLDYAGNSQGRKRFARWLDALWAKKDVRMSALLGNAPAASMPQELVRETAEV